MKAIIGGNSTAIAMTLRKSLLRHGFDCPITSIVTCDQLAGVLARPAAAVDAIFVNVPADREIAAGLLRLVRSRTSAKVVVIGPARDPHAIIEALHAGADFFVDEDASYDDEVAHIVVRLQSGTGAPVVGRLIAVASASGGTGCTMLSANLGLAFAKLVKSCGVFDFSPGYGALAEHLSLQPRHTRDDVIRNADTLDREMLSQSLTHHSSGVAVLAAGTHDAEFEDADEHALDCIVQVAKQMLSVAIIDLGRMTHRRYNVVRQADTTIVVLRSDFASVCETRRMLDDWQRQGIDLGRLVFVANRCGQAVEIPISKIPAMVGFELAVVLPEDAMTAGISINCGNPAIHEAPSSRLSKAIHAFAAKLMVDGNGALSPDTPNGNASRGNAWYQRVAGSIFC